MRAISCVAVTWKSAPNVVADFRFSSFSHGHLPLADGFNGSTSVKQADVVLLLYPLEYAQPKTQASIDLQFYAGATSASGQCHSVSRAPFFH